MLYIYISIFKVQIFYTWIV